MANYVEQEILAKLDRLKNDKTRPGYLAPKDYQSFLPATLGLKKRDDSQNYVRLDQINEKGKDATRLTMTYAQNQRDQEEYLRRQAEMKRAKQQWKSAKRSQPTFTGGGVSSGGGGTAGGDGPTGYSAGLGFKVGVGDYLTTVNVGGHSFTVNKFAAKRFTGFVGALINKGYSPVSIGGYSNRNQANGSGLKSLHAYGLAIDIDPSKNPFIQNSQGGKFSLPPNVGALAAKYGLSWGGNWRNSKDYMHFSIPYGGRE